MPSANIFISYRRDDSKVHVGRLYDTLASRLSPQNIFIDLKGIVPGEDFAEVIEKAVTSSAVLLAVIGKRWLYQPDGTRRALDSEKDFVRLEIETALNKQIRVIPVLVDGAELPDPSELPEKLQRLTTKQTAVLSDDRWQDDTETLIQVLQSLGVRKRRRQGFLPAVFELIKVGLSDKRTRAVLKRATLLLIAILIVSALIFLMWKGMQPRVLTSKDVNLLDCNADHKSSFDSNGFSISVRNTTSTRVRARIVLNGSLHQNDTMLRYGDMTVDETWEAGEDKYFQIPYEINRGTFIRDNAYKFICALGEAPPGS
jgi:hypothetical protein